MKHWKKLKVHTKLKVENTYKVDIMLNKINKKSNNIIMNILELANNKVRNEFFENYVL